MGSAIDLMFERFCNFDPKFAILKGPNTGFTFMRYFAEMPFLHTYEYLEFFGQHATWVDPNIDQYFGIERSIINQLILNLLNKTDVEFGPQFKARFLRHSAMQMYYSDWRELKRTSTNVCNLHPARLPISLTVGGVAPFTVSISSISMRVAQFHAGNDESFEQTMRHIIAASLKPFSLNHEQGHLIATMPLTGSGASHIDIIERVLDCQKSTRLAARLYRCDPAALTADWGKYHHLSKMPPDTICDVLRMFHGLQRATVLSQILNESYAVLRQHINNKFVVEFFRYVRFFSARPQPGPQITARNFMRIYENYYGPEVWNFIVYLNYDLPEAVLHTLCNDRIISPETLEITIRDAPLTVKMAAYRQNSQLIAFNNPIANVLLTPEANMPKLDQRWIKIVFREEGRFFCERDLYITVHLLLTLSDGYYEVRPDHHTTRALHIAKKMSAICLIKIGQYLMYRWFDAPFVFSSTIYDEFLRNFGSAAFFFCYRNIHSTYFKKSYKNSTHLKRFKYSS